VRYGLVPEDYVRHLEYKGQEVVLASETKGYRFEPTPPVPVTVLHGDVHAFLIVGPLAVVAGVQVFWRARRS
jgi:hypothetical protein